MSADIIDPGHGMGNRRKGRFDPGAVSNGVRECDIVMDWANDLRRHLRAMNRRVVRTRVNHADPAPLGDRSAIARHYKGRVMVSLHCNSSGTGRASGTETFYRGAENKALASKLNQAVVDVMQSPNRGPKTENQSQHSSLAIMRFQPCFLIEIGFIDHSGDRAKMQDPCIRDRATAALAKIIAEAFPV
jgi:N-acetylmuramoyl-L-alanine amidase